MTQRTPRRLIIAAGIALGIAGWLGQAIAAPLLEGHDDWRIAGLLVGLAIIRKGLSMPDDG
jgi:hypothetical protein